MLPDSCWFDDFNQSESRLSKKIFPLFGDAKCFYNLDFYISKVKLNLITDYLMTI